MVEGVAVYLFLLKKSNTIIKTPQFSFQKGRRTFSGF